MRTMTGRKLLYVAKCEAFVITAHALARLNERTGLQLNAEQAEALFLEARQVTYQDMLLMGYRPDADGRKARGISSLYFRFVVAEREVIAVLTEERNIRTIMWVTTYAPSRQSEHLRVFRFENLPDAV